MEFDDVIRTTFATREFTSEQVPDDIVWKILDTARFAPSASRRQGSRVIIVRDETVKNLIAEFSKPAARRYLALCNAGESPSNPAAESTITEADLAAVTGLDEFVSPLVEAPVLIVVAVDRSGAAESDEDSSGVVGAPAIYPLVWNILTAARSYGFGGTITTMASPRQTGMQDLLGVPASHTIAAVLPIGRPVTPPLRFRRESVSDFATLDTFDGDPLGGSPGDESGE